MKTTDPSLAWQRIAVILLLIIGTGTVTRLYRITGPFDGGYTWRQYDTAAIARNFYEGTMNILYPQVDWRGNSQGYVESEFPVYQFLVAACYRAFGLHDWLGRAFNVLVYGLSAVVLFLLASRLFGQRVGLFAAFFYSAVPLSFGFTRTFQPDALMAFGSLVGIYYFWAWTEENRWAELWCSGLGVCLATLIKPSNLYLGLPLLYLCYRKWGWRFWRKPVLWFYAAGVLLPSVLWYWHAQNLWNLYGNTFAECTNQYAFSLFWPGYWGWLSLAKQLTFRLIFEIATPLGLPLLFMGLALKPPGGNYLLQAWAAGFAVSVVIAAWPHRLHAYYQLPIVFVTSTAMAIGADALWKSGFLSLRFSQWATGVLFLGVIASSLWVLWPQLAPPLTRDRILPYAEQVNHLTEPDALVIMVGSGTKTRPAAVHCHRTAWGEYLWSNPIGFYLSHRKGWSLEAQQATPEFIETLRRRGARYFATAEPEILQSRPELRATLDRCYTPLEKTTEWALYRLDKPCTGDATTTQPEQSGSFTCSAASGGGGKN